jgi:hypothetical protein
MPMRNQKRICLNGPWLLPGAADRILTDVGVVITIGDPA